MGLTHQRLYRMSIIYSIKRRLEGSDHGVSDVGNNLAWMNNLKQIPLSRERGILQTNLTDYNSLIQIRRLP